MRHLTATATSPYAHNKQMGLTNIQKFLATMLANPGAISWAHRMRPPAR